MTLEEYEAWQKTVNTPKVYAESTKAKWRKQAREAVQKAAEAEGDRLENINSSYPSPKKDCTRYLIWLQERRKVVGEFK